MINFVVIGGGWRTEFYLRIARALPQIFNISAVCVRNTERAEYISGKYGVKVSSSVDELLNEPFQFIVNCINKEDISDLSTELADKGYYVLSETPVVRAPVPGHSYDKIQVAEQFHLKGTYQAYKKIIQSGIIGDVGQIDISAAHDYHAMSIVRFLIDDYEEPRLLADCRLDDSVLITNGRAGELDAKSIGITDRNIKIFQFNNAAVIYDYNIQQYFSPIRRDRILIRGTRGEIENNNVRYFNSDNKPVSSDIKKKNSGLLDGFYNDAITFEDKILYKFPFTETRLSEEETAIAMCLKGMDNYIKTGAELYGYKRAYEDYMFYKNV